MPYTIKAEGLEDISRMLDNLQQRTNQVASMALYEGAGIVADELNRQAKAIRTEPFKYATGGHRRLPSPEEKAIVEDAAGIARFNNEGGAEVSTSVGFSNAGYAELAGKIRPIPLIVNSINSGTSFMQKQPFVRKAASNGGKKAVAAMKDFIETELEKIANDKTEGMTK